MERISVIILGALAVFNGAVWASAGGLTLSTHGLGVFNIIVGLVVLVIEIFTHWGPWRRV
jgi:hypothetical protein